MSLDLTPRQRQIAERIARGASNKEIARDLGIAVRTVKTHVEMMLLRCQARSRVEIAAMIGREG